MEDKIYVIHAFENTYGGLHGIESWMIEKTTKEIAVEIAIDESYNVMDSYSRICIDFEEAAEDEGLEPGTEEYDTYIFRN